MIEHSSFTVTLFSMPSTTSSSNDQVSHSTDTPLPEARAAITPAIRKAVIPVAGLGTRMLPATKAIPKEMLPVVDKPLIQYVVNEAVKAGIKEIVLVTHASKNSIENHFDTSFELEATLEKRVKRQLLDEVKRICPPDVTIMHVRQGEAKGLGHAILCAHPLVGDEPFAILLPDVLIDDAACNLQQDNTAAMISAFAESGHSQILVEPVAKEQVDQFGIVDLGSALLTQGKSAPITAMVEKPDREEAPSNLAVVGRYVLSADIWPLLSKTPLGKGDEIQLTDTIAMLMEQQAVDAHHITGKSHDCGNKLGLMMANVEYGMRHATLGDDFRQYLKQLTL
ncbi:MAG: UTP--glucose-1-phosphate uridylyltransferase GalU [Oceanisphaera sp.]|uniref:UTP--glucose-1-phosphate uridylyltransferase GalU n=1 Tax=Oceanisphaera sp. TaxID=1929979 RepID=UPI003F985D3D